MECPECGYEIEESCPEYECPYCGKDDFGEGFYTCENCGALITWNGDLWECWWCDNDGPSSPDSCYDTCPSCGGIIEDDGYCSDCSYNEDVNQGWLGENC